MFGLVLKAIATIAIISGCANPLMQSSGGKSSNRGKMIEVPLSLTNRSASKLSLTTDIVDFTMSVTGCASGWTRPITGPDPDPIESNAAGATVALYQKDVDCLVGLKSFTVGLITYSSAAGEGITAGSEIFTDGGTNQVRVTVLKNIDAPIDSSSEAVFAFQEIIGTEDAFVVLDYSESAELFVQGIEAPNVSVIGMDIESISPYDAQSGTGGVATFTVTIKCNGAVAGDNPDKTCATEKEATPQSIKSMDLSLVTDDWAGNPAYSDAEAAFSNDSVNAAASAAVTGGTGAIVAGVAATERLWTHKEMILFVRYSEEIEGQTVAAYRYFKVTMGDPQ